MQTSSIHGRILTDKSELMATPKAHLLPLTGMRFFLALWVVIFHQSFFPGDSWTSPLPKLLTSLLQTGYLAVGLFFVLSGFVLSYNYPLGRPWSLSQVKKFAALRFARLYPAYCIGLALSLPWVAVFLAAHLSSMTIIKKTTEAVLTWALLQAWVPGWAEAWNGPGWSLSVEAFFYCCFPILGVALWRLSRPSSLFVAGFAIWALSLVAPLIAVNAPLLDAGGVPGRLWNSDTTGLWVNFVKFNPVMHIPEFCIGIVIGRVHSLLRAQNDFLIRKGYWLYLPGIVLELVAIWTSESTLYPFLHNGLLLPLHSIVILGFALDGGILARVLSFRHFVLLGNASYSIYIFQSPVAGWVYFIAKRWFHTQPGGLGITLLFVSVLTGFSLVVFRVIEEPANRLLKGKLTSSSGFVRHSYGLSVPTNAGLSGEIV